VNQLEQLVRVINEQTEERKTTVQRYIIEILRVMLQELKNIMKIRRHSGIYSE
jgi:hypothetical protein